MPLHQIGSESDFGGIKTVHQEGILKEGSIEHYIPVVGQIHITARIFDILHPVECELSDALGNDSFVGMEHYLPLEICNRAYAADHVPDLLCRFVREDIGSQYRKHRIL